MTDEDFKQALRLLRYAISYLPDNSSVEYNIKTFLARVDPVYSATARLRMWAEADEERESA